MHDLLATRIKCFIQQLISLLIFFQLIKFKQFQNCKFDFTLLLYILMLYAICRTFNKIDECDSQHCVEYAAATNNIDVAGCMRRAMLNVACNTTYPTICLAGIVG